jgi:hypothetical protein
MSIQTPTTYNPEAIFAVIDGSLIEGLTESGVSIDHEAKGEITEGMDSGVTFEASASRMCKVTISLRAASVGARTMQEIKNSIDADLRSGAPHPVITGTVRDPINGSMVTSGNVFFLNQPRPNFASKSGEVTWELAFCNYYGETAVQVPY